MNVEAIVVGGSYAGLSAAMQLARARRPVLVIDAGQPRNRFSIAAHGFFGQDGMAPATMIANARDLVLAYPTVHFAAGQAVAGISTDEGFRITMADGATHVAPRLVLATGVIDELPTLPGLAERWGVTVLHCPYCHGYEVATGQLGVLATMPSVQAALLLPDWGPTTLFTNDQFVPDDDQIAALRARGVTLETTPVTALVGEAPALSGVELADGRLVPIDALFIHPRTRLASELAEQLGCLIEEGPLGPVIVVDDFKMTSVPGIYAAGDAARTMHNATLASADGVLAGVAAHRSLVFTPAA